MPWAEKAARAGKHVLCEKPLALCAAEAESLLAVRDETGVQIQEAYVVLHHPQWHRVRELVQSGRIGRLRAIQGWFSYRLEDADNYRNKPEMGGGGLLDIGVYPLVIAGFVFADEPRRVFAFMERDPEHGVDVLTSAIVEFPAGILTFTCAARLVDHQHMALHGTDARIELADPFAQAPSRSARISILRERPMWEPLAEETETLERVDQYVLQAEAFCRTVRGETPSAFPLEASLGMLRTLDALFRSAQSGQWEEVSR